MILKEGFLTELEKKKKKKKKKILWKTITFFG